MQDIQDGIKVSIQDGVTEDPTTVIPSVIAKSWAGKNYLMQEIDCPTPITVLDAEVVTPIVASTSTVLGTVVT